MSGGGAWVYFDGAVFLPWENIWPDKDGPEEPTLQDVLAVIRKDYPHEHDVQRFIRDWSLGDAIDAEASVGLKTERIWPGSPAGTP